MNKYYNTSAGRKCFVDRGDGDARGCLLKQTLDAFPLHGGPIPPAQSSVTTDNKVAIVLNYVIISMICCSN